MQTLQYARSPDGEKTIEVDFTVRPGDSEITVAQKNYANAIRNMSPVDIDKLESSPRIQPDDSAHTVHVKEVYAKLQELGHGVIDFRPPRPSRVSRVA